MNVLAINQFYPVYRSGKDVRRLMKWENIKAVKTNLYYFYNFPFHSPLLLSIMTMKEVDVSKAMISNRSDQIGKNVFAILSESKRKIEVSE